VHLISGVWGLVAGGLFTAPTLYQEAFGSSSPSDFYQCAGLFYGGSGNQLGANLVFMLVAIPWNLATVGLLFVVCTHFGIMRVSRLVEMVGIDTMHHNDGPAIEEDEDEENMDLTIARAGGGGAPISLFDGLRAGGDNPLTPNGLAFSQPQAHAWGQELKEETEDTQGMLGSMDLKELVIVPRVTVADNREAEHKAAGCKLKKNSVIPL